MATLQMEPATANTPNLMLEQSRVIRAPRERVYAAWTNPELLKQWFGPKEFTCPVAELDVRVGGVYTIDVKPSPEREARTGHTLSTATGEYTKVVPNELLQFTWDPSWNPGELSLVTVTFADARGGTQVTIRHERFMSEQSRDGHQNGWAGSLEKLAVLGETL